MLNNRTFDPRLLTFCLPLLLVLFLACLVCSPLFQKYPQELAIGITLDLLLTLPLLWFLIIRKRDIPKITVVSAFIIGLIIASYLLPVEQQSLLETIKTYAFPIVEMGVLTFVFYTFRKTWLAYQSEKKERPEFFTALNEATQKTIPGRVGVLLATEIAVVYYGFFAWKKPTLATNEFSNHKKSGIVLVLYVFMGLVVMETFAMHIVVERWSVTAAWILTALSVYTCFQLFALIRSMPRRPIKVDIENRKLYLRYGFFSEAIIDLKDLERIELTARSLPENKGLVALTPLDMLDSHNVVLHLKSDDNVLHGFYGRQSTFKGIALYVDDKNTFVETLQPYLSKV